MVSDYRANGSLLLFWENEVENWNQLQKNPHKSLYWFHLYFFFNNKCVKLQKWNELLSAVWNFHTFQWRCPLKFRTWLKKKSSSAGPAAAKAASTTSLSWMERRKTQKLQMRQKLCLKTCFLAMCTQFLWQRHLVLLQSLSEQVPPTSPWLFLLININSQHLVAIWSGLVLTESHSCKSFLIYLTHPLIWIGLLELNRSLQE